MAGLTDQIKQGVGNMLTLPSNQRLLPSEQSEVGALASERAGLRQYQGQQIGDIGNRQSRLQHDLRRMASMRVAQNEAQQGIPTSGRAATEQAVRRMRARQGIVARGDKAIANQTMKDRLRAVQQTQTRRGQGQNMLQQAQQIKQGVNIGVSDANNRAKASTYGMYGSAAGMLAKGVQTYMNRPPGITQGMDQGTASADYQMMYPDVGTNYSNFETNPQGLA
jgi:hypothetical protein